MRKVLFFIVAVSFHAWSSGPEKISFKCDTSGRVTNFVSPLDITEAKPEINADAKCTYCTEDLDKIAAFARDDMSIINRLLKQKVDTPIIFPRLPYLYFDQKKTPELDADDFIFIGKKDKNKKIKLYYPYNTPYSYVMGYQPQKSSTEIPLPDYEQIKQLIEKSVAMGVDPYLAVSIAQMENPFNYNLVHQHVHDNTAAKVLGCDTSPGGKQKQQTPKWTFNTSKFENLRIVMNSHKLKGMLKINVKEGTSYLCVGDKNTKEFHDYRGISINEDIREDRYCCLTLPVSVPSTKDLLPTRYHQNINTEYVSNMILFELLRDMQKKKSDDENFSSCANGSENTNSPEHRIQSFLGFSINTGTGMANNLATWRLGVNSCDDPTYGIQAMDFIVNTLMPNPLIKKLVNDAEEKFGKISRHHICLGKEGSTQSMELDHYIKMHKNSVRFSLIKRLIFKDRKELTEIEPKRNLQPFAQELVNVPRIRKSIELKYGPDTVKQLELISDGNYEKIKPIYKDNINSAAKDYFSNFYSDRDTLGKASVDNSQGMSWKKFTGDEFHKVYKKIMSK